MTIVLASNSASRKAMLDAAGIDYVAQGAQVDERALEAQAPGSGAADIALLLAEAKAMAINGAGQLVLGSDSLVSVDGCRFDKPASRDEAAGHLQFFSGKIMHLHSAAALAREGSIVWRHGAMAALQVHDLSNDFIESYLDAEWPHIGSCAGAFRIEARGPTLFRTIEGDMFTVLGMPLLAVLTALRDFGELPA